MRMHFLKITALFVLSVLILASCSGRKTDDEEAKVREAFDGAYTAATYFSWYATDVYAEGSIEFDYDSTYLPVLRYERFAPCGTLAELDELLNTYFTSEIIKGFKAVEPIEDEPLYIEKDGALYRYSNYEPIYIIGDEYIEIVSVEKTSRGKFTVSVEAKYPNFYGAELETVTYDYTCKIVNGTYKFTGEFPMLADIAIDQMLERNFILPLA